MKPAPTRFARVQSPSFLQKYGGGHQGASVRSGARRKVGYSQGRPKFSSSWSPKFGGRSCARSRGKNSLDSIAAKSYTQCIMTGKRLREIRDRMGLTQAQVGERLKLTGNGVARMERGEVLITEPMALLISYVAREAGVDPTQGHASRRAAPDKKTHRGKARDSVRAGRSRQGR